MSKSKSKKQRAKSIIFLFKFCFVFFLFYFYFSLSSNPALAEEASQSGSLIDKLNQLKSEIASKAAQLKTQVSQKVQNKAFIGSIISVNSYEITLQTKSSKTIKHDEFTEILGAKNRKIKAEDLETNDKIAALGDVDDKNVLVAQKILYLEPSQVASNSAQLFWGQILKSQGSTISIVTKEGVTENISTNSQTQFFLGINEASLADSKVEQKLLTRATRLKNGTLRARYIYFIPSSGFTKPIEKSSPPPAGGSKSATPSSSLKPSPKS